MKLKKYLPHNLPSTITWLLSLILIIGGIYYFYSVQKNNSVARKPADNASTSSSSEAAVTKTQTQLDAMASKGDVTGSLKAYDSAIASASDATAKRELLLYKATVALNNKQYDVALAAAQAADSIKSDFNTLSAEAESYDGMNNYAKAIEYYQKAADDPTEFNFDKPFYQSRIAELKKVINE